MTELGATAERMGVVRKLFEEVINTHRLDLCDRYLSPRRVDHESYGMPKGMADGHDGFQRVLGTFISGFPDLHLDIEFMVADERRVAVYVRTTGTHSGEFMGAPPTGRRFSASGVDIFAFDEAGLVSEHWGSFDTLGVMLQLGLLPSPELAAAA